MKHWFFIDTRHIPSEGARFGCRSGGIEETAFLPVSWAAVALVMLGVLGINNLCKCVRGKGATSVSYSLGKGWYWDAGVAAGDGDAALEGMRRSRRERVWRSTLSSIVRLRPLLFLCHLARTRLSKNPSLPLDGVFFSALEGKKQRRPVFSRALGKSAPQTFQFYQTSSRKYREISRGISVASERTNRFLNLIEGFSM